MATQMARIAIEAKHGEEILRMVFETAPGAMFIADLDGNIVRANDAFAALLGWTVPELRGKDFAEITQDADGPPPVAGLLPPPGDRSAAGQRRYLRKCGGTLWAREHPSLWRDAEDRPRYVLVRVEKLSDAGDDPVQRLSPREREVLDLVVAGHTSKEIAGRLGVSAASVDTYRSRLMLKLDINDVPGLVRFAIRQGIATP
jgi:PAS domain S-box-containing protein